ncbi:hypothetical protein [Faecalibacterium sp. OF04-11AC]|uniref:hypothetical protein n=1 Tax=Faecalibacterium sp. OF04-11AC TaxID=2293109 RepID=UPI001FA8CBBE|nr:hypothetical protein [Faecalibacterium sp. OF04-11AC]
MSIRTQYDSDLEALKAALAEMGRSSADAVEDALEASAPPTRTPRQASSRAMAGSTTWSGTLSTAA